MPVMPLKRRKLNRIAEYDYSQNGYYFVTICTKNKIEHFGKIIDGKMELSEIGKITNKCWLEIPKHFSNVKLDEYTIMPNHVHGILIIETSVGVQNFEPLQQVNKFQHIIPRSLGSIIRGFKIGVTKLSVQNNYDFHWQRSFYDHVVRDEKSLEKIREYIVNNPLKWDLDRNNQENLYM